MSSNCCETIVASAVQRAGQRRDLVGQDDAAERARRVGAGDGTDHHPRRHRRAAAAASTRGSSGNPARHLPKEPARSRSLTCCARPCACAPTGSCVGEVRGAEAVQLVQAMNTGHDGSMSTVHANSAVDAVARVCSLVLQEVRGWPLEAIHDQVRRSIDVVIHVGRAADNRRQIIEVCETDRAAAGVQLRSSGRTRGPWSPCFVGHAGDHQLDRRRDGRPALRAGRHARNTSTPATHPIAVLSSVFGGMSGAGRHLTTQRCSTQSPARFAAAQA